MLLEKLQSLGLLKYLHFSHRKRPKEKLDNFKGVMLYFDSQWPGDKYIYNLKIISLAGMHTYNCTNAFRLHVSAVIYIHTYIYFYIFFSYYYSTVFFLRLRSSDKFLDQLKCMFLICFSFHIRLWATYEQKTKMNLWRCQLLRTKANIFNTEGSCPRWLCMLTHVHFDNVPVYMITVHHKQQLIFVKLHK